MKKTISLLLCLILIVGFISGCNDQTANTSMSIGNNINKKLDKLTLSVTKLDTIDNQYITNPDIMPSYVSASIIVPNPSSTSERIIADNEASERIVKNAIKSNLNTDDLLKQLQAKLKCDDNGNCYLCGNEYGECDNSTCDSCNYNIVCDNNGNCYTCNNCLQLDASGNCTNCNTNCYNGDCSKLNYDGFNEANSCLKNYRNQLETPSLNASQISQPVDNIEQNVDIINNDTDTNIVEDNTDYDSTQDLENENSPKIYYYYEEQNFAPENLRYNPRYITNNDIDMSDNLNNYVIKVQKLYVMTADVVEANNALHSYKDNLLNTISSTKNINEQYKQLNFNPPAHQIQAIKNYLRDLETTTSRIKSANGDLNNEINNINSSQSLGVSNSVDVINSNYLRILNHLDTRITYHESALTTLEQLKYLLLDAIEDNNMNLPVINDNNDVIDNNFDNENNLNDNIDNSDNVDNYLEDDNNDNIDENNQDLVQENTDDLEEENESNEEEVVENDINIIEDDQINDNIVEEDVVEQTNNLDNYNNIEDNEDNLDNNSDETLVDYNELNDTNEETSFITPNIDTYKPDIEDNDEDIIDEDSQNVDNNDNLDENIVENDINTNLDNNNNLNNGAYNNNENVINNNNRIINENNLNTDNNNLNGNEYLYDEDGNLYNTNTNRLNNGKINNVNTYEYNTMLDSLNQGTIDNGINNL